MSLGLNREISSTTTAKIHQTIIKLDTSVEELPRLDQSSQ
jgi:hypothetical protein